MAIRVIPTRTHGIIDHVTGSSLVWGPTLLGLDDDSTSARASRLAGGGATAYSLVTDYELGARRILPMPVHLALDAVSGALLAATPWVSGDSRRGTRYWLPHAVIGGSEMVLAAITQSEPPPETLTGKLGRKVGLTGAAKVVAKAPGSPATKAKLIAKSARGAGKAGKASTKATGKAGARFVPLKLVSAAPGSTGGKAGLAAKLGLGRAAAKATLAAPGSTTSKARLLGRLGAGAGAAKLAAATPRSRRSKGKVVAKAARRKASSKPSTVEKLGVLGAGLAGELVRQSK